jgi:hypothetical protein
MGGNPLELRMTGNDSASSFGKTFTLLHGYWADQLGWAGVLVTQILAFRYNHQTMITIKWEVDMLPKVALTDLREDNEISNRGESYHNKRAYLKPALIRYGHLTIITAGGSGVRSELGPNNKCVSQAPNEARC